MDGKTRGDREAELRGLLAAEGTAAILVTWMRVVPPPGMIVLPPKGRSPSDLIGQILNAEYPASNGQTATGTRPQSTIMQFCKFNDQRSTLCRNVVFRDGVCFEHAEVKCSVCGQQAVTVCPHGSGKLCNSPLCTDESRRLTHSKGHTR